MSPEERDRRDIADAQLLLKEPAFHRFLWRVIQSARILTATTDGSEGRHLAYDEGRRNLGLDILAMVDSGQPAEHPDRIPVLTLIQVLREEANQQPQEKKNDRRNKHDRYSDLNGDD